MTVSFSPPLPEHAAALGVRAAAPQPTAQSDAPATAAATDDVVDISAETLESAETGERPGRSGQAPGHQAKALVAEYEAAYGQTPDMPFGQIVSALARTGDASALLAPPASDDPASEDPDGGVVDDSTVDGTTETDGGGAASATGSADEAAGAVEGEAASETVGGGEPSGEALVSASDATLESELLELLDEDVDIVA